MAQQKAVLLHELQHRVKNSLQVIAGIISLQRRKSRHELVRAELDVVASRIEALRVLYAELFLVNHHTEVELADYLGDLCRSLLQSHLGKDKAVELELDCAPLKVHLDRSAPLGLVTGLGAVGLVVGLLGVPLIGLAAGLAWGNAAHAFRVGPRDFRRASPEHRKAAQ